MAQTDGFAHADVAHDDKEQGEHQRDIPKESGGGAVDFVHQRPVAAFDALGHFACFEGVDAFGASDAEGDGTYKGGNESQIGNALKADEDVEHEPNGDVLLVELGGDDGQYQHGIQTFRQEAPPGGERGGIPEFAEDALVLAECFQGSILV